MAAVNFYLNFPGNTEEAFNFYQSVFGGTFTVKQRFKDNPESAASAPPADQDKIMHISMPFGSNSILMGSDGDCGGRRVFVGNNFSISLATESEAETDKLFNALSVGGQVTMPLAKTFWGAYFGMLTDKFGIQWMMNYDYAQ